MYNKKKNIVMCLVAISSLALGAAFAVAQDETNIQGMISGRTGETLLVKTSEGNATVVLDDSTRTKDDRGLFGLDKDYMSNAVLIPGLKVKIDGVSAGQGRVLAKTITVDGDDLETAEMIQSGLHPTAEQVATNVAMLSEHQREIASNRQGVARNTQGIIENKQDTAANKQEIAASTQKIQQNMKDIQENSARFAALSDFDLKNQETVQFESGSSKLSLQGEERLKQLAQSAVGLTGYIIEVMGFADSTGSALMNTKLSENRAKAVIAYLVQQCHVPVRHIVAPGAMGEYQPLGSNETTAGRAANRRVEVKVLINKGIAGA